MYHVAQCGPPVSIVQSREVKKLEAHAPVAGRSLHCGAGDATPRPGSPSEPAEVRLDPEPADCVRSRRPSVRRDQPNELWLIDVTEHPTREGKVYSALVFDMFPSRRGWSIDSTPAAALVVNSLGIAIEEPAAD
jgi:transposase InsO family protein